jgi:hypothetical protein
MAVFIYSPSRTGSFQPLGAPTANSPKTTAPICQAKTPLSASAKPSKRIRPAFSARVSQATRPMGALQVDNQGALWFMSASASHKQDGHRRCDWRNAG